MTAKLILKDGSTFEGESFGYTTSVAGEVVFSTGMVGYPESLTDPSYEGQILVLTYPLVGNYGVSHRMFWESDRINVSGLIVSNYIDTPSHFSSKRTLSEWLKDERIPALEIKDTRLLTQKLRDKGTMLGKIIIDNKINWYDPNKENLVAKVSTKKVALSALRLHLDKGVTLKETLKEQKERPKTVVLIDCGAKKNIERCLQKRGVNVIVTPWDFDPFNTSSTRLKGGRLVRRSPTELGKGGMDSSQVDTFDALVISNGPGDPKLATKTIETLKKAMERNVPILGICLGHQLLALAAGGDTKKLKFGHRSQNQPCLLEGSHRCYITTQNHGFAVDVIPHGFKPWFTNANDNTNEGLIHTRLPFMSVQFHPEASPGPTDAEWVFDYFLDKITSSPPQVAGFSTLAKDVFFASVHPRLNRGILEVANKKSKINGITKKKYKKILILGSGALKIGEAGEFDYSGSQAIKALKEEGIKTILVNPNIATIQTSKFLADEVYFLPVNEYFVEKIIEKERPDGIFLSFGGQTALNCGINLYKRDILKKHKVEILGTPISAILLTEDRDAFANHLKKNGVATPPSKVAQKVNEALLTANEIGYPVMVRSGFSLGGQGSGIARNDKELSDIATKALSFAPQILVEKYLHHYKEVEYEVVRDCYDNCITVCNMENMDPMGIHTGESIVIAPSQTLTNGEYHALRSIAICVVRSLGVVGECNIQFALNPRPCAGGAGEIEYYVIEVNARLSRSSALASKATGYPLAYVAAKLALGKSLTDLRNKVTQATQFCFEPALDYVTVKIPRWDIEKFKGADEKIGSSMKSVGEVMGIGRTFEEAYQKAIRMLDLDFEGATSTSMLENNDRSTLTLLKIPTPKRMFAIAQAIKEKIPIKKIYTYTGIDPWFLYRIQHIVDAEHDIPKHIKELTKDQLLHLKQLGFSDRRIGSQIGNITGLKVRRLRKKFGVVPYVFQIDTLAGEFPAKTNYLYLTYNGNHHDVNATGKKGVIVLGGGPYRIGSSVEFDWTAVNTALNLKTHHKRSIMINCNPETVSTDYDISDRLYFEELTFERIADIYDFEQPYGITISVGGQTPNNRAYSLKAYGCNILGTEAKNIDRAEDRSKFSQLLDTLDISQPAWNIFTNLETAVTFCENVGFPVLIRPSYVLSGSAMRVCHNKEEFTYYVQKATHISREYPLTISKFIDGAKEIELDAVAQHGHIKAGVLSEHIEHAGVHSGDATIVLPAKKMYVETQKKIEEVSQKLAHALSINGPFNIQFLAKDNAISVIEVNLRSSRTFPFISKVTGVDFIKLSLDAFFGKKISQTPTNSIRFTAVKVPQFSFDRLTGADPILHVEMASTGEVACFGETVEEAFLKGELAVGGNIPHKGVFISLGGNENKVRFLDAAKMIATLNVPIFATENTAAFLKKHAVAANRVYKIHEKKSPNILDLFQKRKVDLAINIVDSHIKKEVDDDYAMRRSAIDHNIHILTNRQKAILMVNALTKYKLDDLKIKAWSEYVL